LNEREVGRPGRDDDGADETCSCAACTLHCSTLAKTGSNGAAAAEEASVDEDGVDERRRRTSPRLGMPGMGARRPGVRGGGAKTWPRRTGIEG